MNDAKNILTLVLDVLIPPSKDGRLPGAGSLGVASAVEVQARATPGLEPLIDAGLSALEELARKRDVRGFAALGSDDRVTVLREVEVADPVFVPTLLMLAYSGYYGHELVITALKPEPHAPHPRGYEVEGDDEALLEPVRSRGKLYRDC
jgi:hypothetical protein